MGYDVDATGQVTKASDETVADAISRVFEKFDELGTARQVFVWWQEQGLPFPARQTAPGLRGLAWVWGTVPSSLLLALSGRARGAIIRPCCRLVSSRS